MNAVWSFIVWLPGAIISFALTHQVLVAAAVAIWGILTQRKISREKNSIDFEASLSINEKYTADLKWLFTQEPDQLLLTIASRSDDFYRVTNVLNTWEQCARSVHTGMFQERYIYKVHGTTVMGIYAKCHKFIEDRQVVNPRYFIQFTVMASDWMCKRYKEEKDDKHSDMLTELLAKKREQNFYTEISGTPKAKHDGHAKEFKQQVKKLKKQLKVI